MRLHFRTWGHHQRLSGRWGWSHPEQWDVGCIWNLEAKHPDGGEPCRCRSQSCPPVCHTCQCSKCWRQRVQIFSRILKVANETVFTVAVTMIVSQIYTFLHSCKHEASLSLRRIRNGKLDFDHSTGLRKFVRFQVDACFAQILRHQGSIRFRQRIQAELAQVMVKNDELRPIPFSKLEFLPIWSHLWSLDQWLRSQILQFGFFSSRIDNLPFSTFFSFSLDLFWSQLISRFFSLKKYKIFLSCDKNW